MQMVIVMKENGYKIKKMEEENIFMHLLMMYMMENGYKIKNMEKDHINLGNSLYFYI